ncbi:hypothetical protein N7495_002444 [Penicillium taxi]|uniref:uncharacterized protein n=1 Tax=Penicillium taxi TaxID=168475 RepID=UPI0025454668|nr:uncharacterized protein N7495_002444 [Penicillium taxi]KAJ5901916.1 hypothetical protein N7495_002444 [Penicillium taxi]
MGVKLRLPRTFRSLAVNDDDQNARWANRDILPVPVEEQKYNWQAYFAYWSTVGINTTAWSISSSQLSNGLDAASAIGGVLVGSCFSAIVALLSGEAGILYRLGFPMLSRSTFGMYGSYFVIVLKCFVNIIFFGIQSYWGGQAAAVVLSSIFPTFAHMKNTLSASAVIETPQLVGFVIYIVIFTSLMFIHPSKLQPLLFFSQILVGCTMLGIFIWAMAKNGGASILPPSKEISHSERSFRTLAAMSSVAGSWTGSSIRQADWTRYAKKRSSFLWHQGITGPIALTFCAVLGISTTSAVKNMYGESIWNPISLLQYIQKHDYSATTRAGTFFAGAGFFVSQVTINLVQNSVSCGMDLASLWPKYIDVTRGSLIMCVVGYVIQPWRFVEAPGVFISVLNSFGMFISPLAGINSVDFWLVRRKNWKVPDLYIGNSSSIYWYTFGWNWRAMLSWCLAIWPSFPGFIASVTSTTGSMAVGWTRTFQVSWIVGFCGGGAVYFLITLVFPPPGGKPYERELLDVEGIAITTGFSDNDNPEIPTDFKSGGISHAVDIEKNSD